VSVLSAEGIAENLLGHAPATSASLTVFSPAGVVAQAAAVRRAAKRLKTLGFAVQVDESAAAKFQRFAGNDDVRLAALHDHASGAEHGQRSRCCGCMPQQVFSNTFNRRNGHKYLTRQKPSLHASRATGFSLRQCARFFHKLLR